MSSSLCSSRTALHAQTTQRLTHFCTHWRHCGGYRVAAADHTVSGALALDFHPFAPTRRVAAIGTLGHHSLDRQDCEPFLGDRAVAGLRDEAAEMGAGQLSGARGPGVAR